jgi:HD superfamily phosphohydrolase
MDGPVGALEAVSAWVAAFCDRSLRPYIDRLKATSVMSDTREINDPVWATISLTAFETVIVDSPLFQRLRRIRQLGVVHWVYPGAVHTRFEHSLGSLHQVQQLVESINRAASQDQGLAINPENAALIRFCALCHDLGYGAMSHVLENAVISLERVQQVLLQFGKKHKIEPPSLSEIIAYYMLGSPAFAEMLQQARAVTKAPHPPPDLIDRAQKAITGQVVYDEMPIFQELISGPFDADKLDYMQRDAFMSGIPAVTDVPRLIRKVRARWVERKKLPPRIAKRVGELPRYLMFGVAFSGSRTLDELLIARVLLFDKVYRHQKVRALEGMVARLLEALASSYKGEPFEIPFLFSDETLLEADRLLTGLESFQISEAKDGSLAVIDDLCSRLRERRLFVRAFVFAMHFPELDEETHRGMGRFVDDAEGAQADVLLDAIGAEIKAAARLIGQAVDAFPDKTLRSYLWLDPPTKRDHSEKVANAFLLKQNDELIRYSDHSKEVPHWAQAYLAKKDVGYLFCIPELQDVVFLATEKLVAEGKFSFRIPASSLAYLKLNDRNVSTLRERLHDSGYYNSVPFATRPWRLRLHAADIEQTCNSVLENLRGYAGPPIGPKGTSVELSINCIRLWLAQFDDNKLIEFGLRVTENIRLFGRTEFSSSVHTFVNENPEFKDAALVPLGDPKDSGGIVAYLAQDTGMHAKSLDEALAEGRPLVLVDDCIGSGQQADDILADWFGEPKGESLHEGKRLTLSERQQLQLKQIPIGFVFCTGLTTGITRLQKQCDDHALNTKIYVRFTDRELPSLFDEDLVTDEAHPAFVSRCKEIGNAILAATHPTWELAKLTERSLGYGNKGLLITFPFNTPTQTLTCLWAGGVYNNLNWIPLIPRTPKR